MEKNRALITKYNWSLGYIYVQSANIVWWSKHM